MREGGEKCPEQQIKLQFRKERGRRRGKGLDSWGEGGFTVYPVQKDVLGGGRGGREVLEAQFPVSRT